MPRAIKVTFTYGLGDDAVMLTVTARVSPGCDDWWSKSVGAWMPGDAPEVEIKSCTTADGKEFVWEDVAVRLHGPRHGPNPHPWRSLDELLREQACEEAAKDERED